MTSTLPAATSPSRRLRPAIRPGGLSGDGNADRPTFRSDELVSVELGSRVAVIDGTLAVNASLFGLRWENLQSDVLGIDGLPVTINAGNATNLGAELGATLTMPRLTLEGGLTAQHGRSRGGSAMATGDTDDRRLPVVPDLSGRLKLSVAQPIGRFNGSAYIAARYIGLARLSFDPGLARSWEIMPSWTSVQGSAGRGGGPASP